MSYLHRHYSLFSRLFVLACIGVFHTTATAAETLTWHDVPGNYIELRQGTRPVMRYMYRSLDESTEQSRFETYKVFHHLFAPGGAQMLTNGPTGEQQYSREVQYPHHRGLYYGFNRISYGEGQQADTWHCGKGESQQHVEILDSEVGTDFGRHRLAINWHGRDGKVFVKEIRDVTARVLPEGTMIDFVSTVEPTVDGKVHLDGDPQHAGVQFRAIDEVAKMTKDQTYYLRTDGKGKPGETRNWDHKQEDNPINAECTNRPWNAMSFVVGHKRYTAVYLDHPANPKPARYSERDYGRFGSYFVHDLEKDKPLTVRYRIWLQEGETTVDKCAALASDFVGTSSQQADNVPPEGFVSLFNGKDLSGWKGLVGNPKTRAAMSPAELAEQQKAADELMREHWSATDGMLVYDSARDGSNICTTKDYGDFELYLDWKIQPGGDSGIYLRGSPQVQIWDPEHEPFFKNGADKGSGSLWNNQKHERFPLVKADNPAGQWNTFFIKMIGEKVTIKLNDHLVADQVVLENYWDREQPIYPTGQIEFQKHDGVLWFKNIFLREIP